MVTATTTEKRFPASPANPGFRVRPASHWAGSAIDVFNRCLAENPDSAVLLDMDRQLTFRQLDDASRRMAAAIVSRLGTDLRPLLLLFDKQVEIGIAMLAAARSGRSYAPLEPSFPLDHLRLIIEDLNPALIIPSPAHEELARSLGLPILTMEEALAHEPDSPALQAIRPTEADQLLVIYTSGTTGRPKGVISQQAWAKLRASQRAESHQISPDERILFIESPNFGRGQGSVWSALLNGHAIFLYDINRTSSVDFANWCNDFRINHWAATPSTFRAVVGKLPPEDRFETMRVIQLGGEMSRTSDFELFKAHFVEPCVLIIGYGLSEAGGISAVCLRHSDEIPGDTMPVGYPQSDRRIFIVDENGNRLPPNTTGEVHVQLQRMLANYLNNAEASRARYYEDPTDPGKTICRTGDLGRLDDDGCLYLFGRIDNQVKVRGMKVNTNDVAAALALHPDVADVLVLGRVDARGNTRLVAYIQSRSGASNPQAFRAFLEPDLPAHMIPAYFIFLDEIPRSVTGKVNSRDLPDIAGQRPALATPYAPPATDLEISLARIWAEILGIQPIGIHDPFIDLGGDSLSATQVFAEVEKRLRVAIPPAVLYTTPTIASLAAKMQAGQVEVKDNTFLYPIRHASITRPVVCFLTPMRGDVMAYADIINTLDPQLTLYGLNSWLLKFRDLRKISLPELAEQYIRELLAIEPEGPYVIGGHSFAGRLAYEMARQMKAQNLDVPFIFMFDTTGPERMPNAIFVYKRWHIFKRLAELKTWGERWAFIRAKIGNWPRYWMRLANMLQVHTGIELPRPSGIPVGTEAMREEYIPEPQSQDILYFRADYDMGKYEVDTSRGWATLSTGKTVTHVIHDNHYEMLKGDSGVIIGRHLMEAIRVLKIN